jgi:hypothetical protein
LFHNLLNKCGLCIHAPAAKAAAEKAAADKAAADKAMAAFPWYGSGLGVFSHFPPS